MFTSLFLTISLLDWLVLQLSSVYAKVVLGALILLSVPLCVKYVAEKYPFSFPTFRLYKLWVISFLALFGVASVLLPPDAATSFRGFGVVFAFSFLTALVVARFGIDTVIWSRLTT